MLPLVVLTMSRLAPVPMVPSRVLAGGAVGTADREKADLMLPVCVCASTFALRWAGRRRVMLPLEVSKTSVSAQLVPLKVTSIEPLEVLALARPFVEISTRSEEHTSEL